MVVSQQPRFDFLEMLARPLLRRADAFLDLARRSRVLDLGCGSGERITGLSGYETSTVVGLDRDPVLLRRSQEQHPHALYVVGDAEHLPFRAASFDAILSFSVLQYVDWRVVAFECRAVLRTGGKAVFHENLAGSPIAQVYRWYNRVSQRDLGTFLTPRRHLHWDDLPYFETVFGRSHATPIHLTTPVLFPLVSFKKHRLRWVRERLGRAVYPVLFALDRVLLRRAPGLARRSWMVAIYATNDEGMPARPAGGQRA